MFKFSPIARTLLASLALSVVATGGASAQTPAPLAV